MWNKIVEWFRNLWNDSDPYIESMYFDEYGYLRDKYGIQQPFIDEDEDEEVR